MIVRALSKDLIASAIFFLSSLVISLSIPLTPYALQAWPVVFGASLLAYLLAWWRTGRSGVGGSSVRRIPFTIALQALLAAGVTQVLAANDLPSGMLPLHALPARILIFLILGGVAAFGLTWLALVKEQSTDAAAKARWNQFLELVRIPSPPRQEHLKAAEIHRRLVNEWGFSPEEVMTRADGVIAASDTNLVDGLPVYNACVVIKGSYSSRADAQQYHGQFPKVLVEGHIDVVNPEELPKSGDPSMRIKLQPYAQPVVATPEELAAIPDELSFDARGRVIEDDKYATASRVFKDAKDAEAGGGVRLIIRR